MLAKIAPTDTSGTVIILNGASSAGKTSLLRAVQAIMPRPYLNAGIDQFVRMLPEHYVDSPLWPQVFGQMNRSGPLGHQLIKSMHHTIASLAASGWAVVADHVFIEREWVYDLATATTGLRVWLIGVRCPPNVLALRDRERGDRPIGQAAHHHGLAHRHGLYDLEIDTSTAPPNVLATRIKEMVGSAMEPSALAKLASLPIHDQ